MIIGGEAIAIRQIEVNVLMVQGANRYLDELQVCTSVLYLILTVIMIMSNLNLDVYKTLLSPNVSIAFHLINLQ